MWELTYTDKIKSKLPKYKRNHPNEVAAIADNVDTMQIALRGGAKPGIMHFGFLHREQHGVVAVDQSGGSGGSSLKESRLYIYPDEASKTLCLITIGEKENQQHDLSDCREFMKTFHGNIF